MIRLNFVAALLSRQLEQLGKGERELRQERQEMGAVKADVQVSIIFPMKRPFVKSKLISQDMEMKVKQQAFSLQSQSTKVQV